MYVISFLNALLFIFLTFYDPRAAGALEGIYERSQELCPGVVAQVSVVAGGADEKTIVSAINYALTGARESCVLLGEWDKRSQIKQLNQYAGQGPIVVGRDLQFLLPQLIRLAEQTGGAFDPTAWSKQKKTRFTDLWYDSPSGRAMLKRKDASISLRGVLNGYLADRIAARLVAGGLPHFMISVGGMAMKAHGNGPHSSWMTGIADPRQPQAESVCRVALVDRSMVTVTDSAWSPEKLSFPGAASFMSVTVLAPYAFEANALANAAMVMGNQIQLLISGQPRLGAILMDHNGRLQVIGSVPAACMY